MTDSSAHVVEHPADTPDTAAARSGLDIPTMAAQERMVEAILFAAADPVSLSELAKRMPIGSDPAEAMVLLRKRYDGRGVQIVKVGDAWALRTAPDLSHLMRKEVQETRKLSRAAIESLAIIAYHQPITRTEIEEIRGVAVNRGTIDQLMELGWIRLGRRRMTPGRPVTFVVTEKFLDQFGLESARDLPGIAELRAAGLLDNRPPMGAGQSIADDDDDEDVPESEAQAAKTGLDILDLENTSLDDGAQSELFED